MIRIGNFLPLILDSFPDKKPGSRTLAINAISVGLGVIANSSLFCLVSVALLAKLEKYFQNGKRPHFILLRRITKVLHWISTFYHRLLLTTTVTGYLASFLLAALTIAASKHFARPPGVGWTQAYFFAIFSAGGYFLISCFMLVTTFETRHQRVRKEYWPSESASLAPSFRLESHACTTTHGVGDSPNQTAFYDVITSVDRAYFGTAESMERFYNKRTISKDGHLKFHQDLEFHYKIDTGPWGREFIFDTHHHWLMLYTVLFLVYVQLVSKLYSSIEGWRYLDSFYWVIVTALTVGFGDIKPMSSTGRGLVCLVAPISMVLLGIVVYHIGKIVLEEARSTMEEQMKSRKREKEAFKRHHGDHDIADGRRNQYDKMRRIQHCARLQCQAITFTVSLASWLFLWHAGAFFFHLCE